MSNLKKKKSQFEQIRKTCIRPPISTSDEHENSNANTNVILTYLEEKGKKKKHPI